MHPVLERTPTFGSGLPLSQHTRRLGGGQQKEPFVMDIWVDRSSKVGFRAKMLRASETPVLMGLTSAMGSDVGPVEVRELCVIL